MKIQLAIILTAVAFTGMSYAGPSDSAAFALRHAQEVAARESDSANRIALVHSGNSGECSSCQAQAQAANCQSGNCQAPANQVPRPGPVTYWSKR